MAHTLESFLVHYGISLNNAFLPSSPVRKLQDPYYAPWEQLVENLPDSIEIGSVRATVDNMPVLSTSRLHDEDEWRRAYVVLAYLTHAYIWGGDQPKDRLPPSISRPLIQIASHLELPPCVTYAACCLWNFSTKSETASLTNPENVAPVVSFTGTKDEEWFFMISVAIEATGAALIPQMLNAIDAVDANDASRVAGILTKFAAGLDDVTRILSRMNEKCSAPVFYHRLRPFLAGSKNMANAGLPNGVFYDLGDGQGEWRQYSGGSNAQSSLIQTFDIFLGVEHKHPDPAGYLHSIRDHMPGPHRRFLETLTQLANVRPFALAHSAHSPVRTAYNAAVRALTALRDKHLQIVARYIMLASKAKSESLRPGRVNLATVTSQVNEKEVQGTGGTRLMPFLKNARDATKECVCSN